jgi:hypothetical protein
MQSSALKWAICLVREIYGQIWLNQHPLIPQLEQT